MKVLKSVTFSIAALTIAATCLINGCSDNNEVMPDGNLKSSPATASEDLADSDFITYDLPDCNFIKGSATDLTADEVEGLKYVREEEKMARDVYLFLSQKFKKPIFKNIKNSEQVHMDKVLCLLIHFNVEDPASDEIGEFTNYHIQELYDYLIDLGSNNIIDALTAGAIIEDYDIKDINDWMEETDNETIEKVFTNIVCGSGNHIISFSDLLDGYDTEYTPIYISDDEYEAILLAGHQNCNL